MKILYTGMFGPESLTEARRRALVALGHEVVGVDQAEHLRRGPLWLQKLQMHALFGPGIARYNAALRAAAAAQQPHLIYIDQAMYLWPVSVMALRQSGARLIHYTSEYLGFRPYLYRHFLKAAPLYDVHVVTNRLTARMLMEHGSKRVVFTEFGFDPKVHYPRCLTQAEKARYNSDAVFVGHWEPAYEEKVQVLREEGMSVAVYGPGWSRSKLSDRKNIRPLATAEYLKALSGARIGLGLLSRWNHNESASRSFEIPAIGVFLLGQRTQDHLSYFQEAKEAEFFGSNDELSDKARYYVARSEIREAVARAGRNRCLSSRYTQLERTRDILAAIT